jgi:2-succinyl-5-enolpyruvyl-6-hydroxy-3-cyclohexene-1-carboxylate synthase
LYPAIVEAGMDGVPLLIVTADRPYESRDTGANQAIDQVKAYSQSYVRWFRDILPPHDDVPVSVALADAAHAVMMARHLMGPVHLNVQFRENLAPDGGAIRNDDRTCSIIKFDNVRFTDAAGFQRWSLGGRQWLKSSSTPGGADSKTIVDIFRLIMNSRRGIIVVGNIRQPTEEHVQQDMSRTGQLISSFAQSFGFPVFAGVQASALRFESSAVVPFAEHILRCPTVQENLKPDFVLQLGTPLISTEIPKIIKVTMNEQPIDHVMVHRHHPHERANPEFTVTHIVNANVDSFLLEIMTMVGTQQKVPGSELAPLVTLGRMLQEQMPKIVEKAVSGLKRTYPDFRELTEPEVVMKLAEVFTWTQLSEISLFLSNSMPVRDTDAFLYPTSLEKRSRLLAMAGVNRGASGIDGVIASAAGFADSTGRPTTLLIGDVAALHDINSLHALRTGMTAVEAQAQKIHPLTTIVLNNDGGGIFSFLPIAKHGSDVSFEEFFGTPTNTFSFERGAQAFDLPYHRAENSTSFEKAYLDAISSHKPSVVEVVVASREHNVAVHKEITAKSSDFLMRLIESDSSSSMKSELLPMKHRRAGKRSEEDKVILGSKTLVMLHGWMGDKSEWDEVESRLAENLPSEWSIIALDLPGHGNSTRKRSHAVQSIRDALRLVDEKSEDSTLEYSLDEMAITVCRTLKSYGVESLDVLVGYSLGGRVALAMKRLSMLPLSTHEDSELQLVNVKTKMILVSTYPGDISGKRNQLKRDVEYEKMERILKDEMLADEMNGIVRRSVLSQDSPEITRQMWSTFLDEWYSAPLWGSLRSQTEIYLPMLERRLTSLSERGSDLASVLRKCSPPRCSSEDWRGVSASNTLFIVGEWDRKYSSLGREWVDIEPSLTYVEIPEKGHALLVEAPRDIADTSVRFLLRDEKQSLNATADDSKIWEARFIPTKKKADLGSQSLQPEIKLEGSIGSLDFELFNIDLRDEKSDNRGLLGIGWGLNAQAIEKRGLKKRSGYVIQIMSKDGLSVGIGEVSPLNGLHPETLEMAGDQLEHIASELSKFDPEVLPTFDAVKILALEGSLDDYIFLLASTLGLGALLPSVRSGLEMSLLSLASLLIRSPLHLGLAFCSPQTHKVSTAVSTLALNGLQTRDAAQSPGQNNSKQGKTLYPSIKVKIGHQSEQEDLISIQSVQNEWRDSMIRADGNRGFNQSSFLNFTSHFDPQMLAKFEYIEEPLERQLEDDSKWSLETQVNALERCFHETSIPYALDETIFDLMHLHQNEVNAVEKDLRRVFMTGPKGCASVVLKPSLLGLENSLRLARFVRAELGIGAVFTSSFDSGIGLAYTSFLAGISDVSPAKEGLKSYPHGLSTFEVMANDCLSPPFASYVNDKGILNVASLSRAFYGLALDEIQSLSSASLPPPLPLLEKQVLSPAFPGEDLNRDSSDFKISELAGEESDFMVDEFEASTSSSGRDIVLVASLPLPFPADIACARFTDLPQQPRWSPWLASVAYLDAGGETEWTLRVRGVNFRWRAKSELLDLPNKGIRWKSTSGVKNTGVVEFVPTSGSTDTSTGTCTIKVQMAFVIPRLLSSLFRGTIVEDFLRNKIMKWSLEMFRDVVKGDLALEEGNIELGDALFGAVEGKASAIEATLASSSASSSTRSTLLDQRVVDDDNSKD